MNELINRRALWYFCACNASSVVIRSTDVGADHSRCCTVRRHWELGGRQLRSVRQTTAAAALLSWQRV